MPAMLVTFMMDGGLGDALLLFSLPLPESESEPEESDSLVPGWAMSICKFLSARGMGLGEALVAEVATAGEGVVEAEVPVVASLGTSPGLSSIHLTMQRWLQNLESRAIPLLRSRPHWKHVITWTASSNVPESVAAFFEPLSSALGDPSCPLKGT